MATEQARAARSGHSPAGVAIVKRSIAIAGHRTSVSLEEAFWRELKTLARRRGLSVGALVAAIDAERKSANLSSAIRVFVLEELAGRHGEKARLPVSGNGEVRRDSY
jgi:predicted DNA-binding ribbon-helix-helix protein